MLDSVSWCVPQKVIYSQLSGTIHLQDIQEMMQTGYDMIEADGREDGVHGVIDVSRRENYARDLMNLHAIQALSRPHPKARWVILVDATPHPVMRFISLSVIKLMKVNYALVTSEAEAMEILHHVDRALLEN